MTRTYLLSYDGETLAEVSIDETVAAPAIREMVQFWAFWERALAKAGGDYTRCWLRHLAQFLLCYRTLPGTEDEGWLDLNEGVENRGIKVLWVSLWEHDPDLIEVTP